MKIRQYHNRDFLPLEALADLKAKTGTTVSLVVPTVNEAATVGNTLSLCREALMQSVALVDEMVVVDGGSSDGTPEIARQSGATVYRAADIDVPVEAPDGKGTSLWKSLLVTTGDIVVFIDADVVNFETHFVFGLVGALLKDSKLCWAKAYYRRPYLAQNDELGGQGGRVTEILVRPLLSAWYPELALVRQPLAGECAFRRESIMKVPFSSGYGVELQVLLSMYRTWGLSRMAQVDMDVRLHRNRPVDQLGRMSFAILKTFLAFLQEEGRIAISSEQSDVMVSHTERGIESTPVREAILPPAESIARERK